MPAICRRFLILISLLTGSVAFAQIAPEQVPFGRTVPLRDVVRLEMESSWMRFGPLRLQRHIELFGALDDEQRARLLSIADRCPVKQALSRGIEVEAVV